MNLKNILSKIKQTSRKLTALDDRQIKKILYNFANEMLKDSKEIIKANAQDLKKLKKNDPIYDRVLLNDKRIKEMAESVKIVADYDSPIDIVLEERKIEKGMRLKKISVPIGVIGIIFEARPNVIVDVFTLCFKSKNACVMKGGSQAEKSYEAIMKIIKNVLKNDALSDAYELLPNDRKISAEMMKSDKYIDVIIPRGGAGLIKFVRENSTVPVIETGAGVVHVFVDESAKTKMAAEIIFNAKTQRPGVCNAMDTLIIHEKKLNDLGAICKNLVKANVEIFADEKSYKVLQKTYPEKLLKKAKKEHFGKEFLNLKMSVKTVKDIDEAIINVTRYGSGHSEAIVTENKKNAEKYLKEIDAAAVYVNASTRFTDGGVFGLGAEMGVSTQKLHARGPMGIKELTSYKWEIIGNGQVR